MHRTARRLRKLGMLILFLAGFSVLEVYFWSGVQHALATMLIGTT